MTKKITRPKDWDRPGKRGQKAFNADMRAPTEAEYRDELYRRTRERARKIADGSYVNEPWAPNAATHQLCVVVG